MTKLYYIFLYVSYIKQTILFPLNCSRWFRCNVVHDTVDVLYFVYDTTGDCVQYVVRDARPVSSHEVCCCYATQCQCVIVCTEVPHNAYSTCRCSVYVIAIKAPLYNSKSPRI